MVQLRAGGRVTRGWMGVGIQSLTKDISGSIGFDGTKGAIVTSVQPDGPSFKAGVQPGDIVLGFNGQSIIDSNQLIRLVGDTPVGIDVPLKVWRNGDVLELSLTTAERVFATPEPINAQDQKKEPEIEPIGIVEGLILRPLDAAARERYEVPDNVVGVVIRKMAAQSEAAQRGLRPGDVIAEVNLTPIHSAEDFSKEVAKAKEAGRKAVLLRIYRSGFLIIPLPLSQ